MSLSQDEFLSSFMDSSIQLVYFNEIALSKPY